MNKNINTKLNKWCERMLNSWEERTIRRSRIALWQVPIIGVIMLVMLIFLGADGIHRLGPLEEMIIAIVAVLIENIIRKIIKWKKDKVNNSYFNVWKE